MKDGKPECKPHRTRKGIPQSAETRAKISEKMKGRSKSPETREKMSAAKEGYSPSKETLEKAWEAKRKTRVPDNPCAKEWIIVSPNGTRYKTKNLLNFIREHSSWFGVDAADDKAVQHKHYLFSYAKMRMKRGYNATCCGGWSVILHENYSK